MRFWRHLLATATALARDARIPRWLRWLFAFGLMPIPLFFDELALIVATALMAVFHHRTVREVWKATAPDGGAQGK